MLYIELFNSLNFDKNLDFKQHIFNIQQTHTNMIINNYLKNINNIDISTKDFLSIITIYYYNNDFDINTETKKNIFDYYEKYKIMNKIIDEKDIHNYYIKNIQPMNQNINILIKDIVKNTSDSAIQYYIKFYYIYNNLLIDFDDLNKNEALINEKKHYYKLLIDLIKDDKEINIIINKNIQKLKKEYNEFRKNLFFDMLEKDMKNDNIIYNGILYLLDIIRLKLLNICPLSIKFNYIKEKINDILNIKYIKQLIDNNVFEFTNLINIFNFIIEILRKFQSENDDEKLNQIESLIQNKLLDNNCKINELLPILMRNLIDLVENLENQVLYYRNNINNLK